MIISKCTEFCNYHHNVVLEHFHHPQMISHSHFSQSPFLLWTLDNHQSTFCIYVLSCTFHINGNIQYVVFYICLLSFSIMFLRIIHIVACFSSLLFFMTEWCSIKWTYHIIINHSPADGPLVALMNNVAMHIYEPFCVLTYIFICLP